VTTLLALPFIAIVIEYFFFLVGNGKTWASAIEQVKKDISLFIFLASLPPIFLAFSCELLLHELLAKIVGTRQAVGQQIADLMASLADSSGYDHPDRIRKNKQAATQWFYVYANQQAVLRTYAFELWESYYVGLYVWLASGIAFAACVALLWFFGGNVLTSFAMLSGFIFFASWAVRRWSTIPKILRLPSQQIAEVRAGSEVLGEARRRFG
jgi:hypothetical protein